MKQDSPETLTPDAGAMMQIAKPLLKRVPEPCSQALTDSR
jgi:hypothetical protein